MEIKGCKLVVTNIKISVTFPLPVCLQSVEKRCKQLSQSRNIYCKRKKRIFSQIVTTTSHTYSLKGVQKNLHHKLKTENDILKAIEILFFYS